MLHTSFLDTNKHVEYFRVAFRDIYSNINYNFKSV